MMELKVARGGGQVVSELALHSDDPSSNPAKAYSFSVKYVFEKNKKWPGFAHFPQKLQKEWQFTCI